MDNAGNSQNGTSSTSSKTPSSKKLQNTQAQVDEVSLIFSTYILMY